MCSCWSKLMQSEVVGILGNFTFTFRLKTMQRNTLFKSKLCMIKWTSNDTSSFPLSQSSSLALFLCLWPHFHLPRSLLCSTTLSRSGWTPRSLSQSCVGLLPYVLKTSVSHSSSHFHKVHISPQY